MKTTSQNQERIGELFILGYVATFGLYPILANFMTKIMPPVLYAGVSNLVTAVFFFIYLLATKQLKKVMNRHAWLPILGVTFFNVILAYALISIGTSKTSGINTSLLLQTEIVFTFIICGLFFKEKITIQKTLGAATILAGAIAILYTGSMKFNLGELLIMAGAICYPFGNKFAKKALEHTSPPVILFIRSIIGGCVLILISTFLDTYTMPMADYIKRNWPLILLNGAFVIGFTKLIFYEGFKRMDITKAISLTTAEVAVNLLYAMIFLREIPNARQMIGFVVIIVGVFVLTYQRKARPTEMAVPLKD
jgi:drug/metabolite transporter (DMT)-like permease